jgi:hypothetical protein
MELNKSERRLLREAERENGPWHRRITHVLRIAIAVIAVSLLWGSRSAYTAARDHARAIDKELTARSGASPATNTVEEGPVSNRQDRADSACTEICTSGTGLVIGTALLCFAASGSRERKLRHLLLRFGQRLVQVGELDEGQVSRNG